MVFKRVGRWLQTGKDITSSLASSLPQWRAWNADYRYLAGARVKALPAAVRRQLQKRRVANTDPLTCRHVVVLPGIYETAADLSPILDALSACGHRIHHVPHLARLVPPPAVLVRRVERYLQRSGLREVLIVAHSKGGLIGKAVMSGKLGERVAGMVAIATPWHGSAYAALFGPGLGLRSLRPGAKLIQSTLANDQVNTRIVSICPAFDPHVPAGSKLAGADNREVSARGHFKVLADTEVIALVAELVTSWPTPSKRA